MLRLLSLGSLVLLFTYALHIIKQVITLTRFLFDATIVISYPIFFFLGSYFRLRFLFLVLVVKSFLGEHVQVAVETLDWIIDKVAFLLLHFSFVMARIDRLILKLVDYFLVSLLLLEIVQKLGVFTFLFLGQDLLEGARSNLLLINQRSVWPRSISSMPGTDLGNMRHPVGVFVPLNFLSRRREFLLDLVDMMLQLVMVLMQNFIICIELKIDLCQLRHLVLQLQDFHILRLHLLLKRLYQLFH